MYLNEISEFSAYIQGPEGKRLRIFWSIPEGLKGSPGASPQEIKELIIKFLQNNI